MSDLHLDNYVPYLLNRAGSRVAASFAERLRDHGISLQMWRVLAALNDGDGQRVSALSERTAIEVSTLSRVIGALEKKGLVQRRRMNGDGRGVLVRRTDAGAALTRQIIPLALKYEDVAVEGMTQAELAQLKTLLKRLYANMARLNGNACRARG